MWGHAHPPGAFAYCTSCEWRKWYKDCTPIFHLLSGWRNSKPGLTEKQTNIRFLFKDYPSIFWHTFSCVDSLLAWFCKQHQSRGHMRSHMTCDAFPQGEFSCYTFCGSHESSTLCTHISHPWFSQHIPPLYLGEIRKWKIGFYLFTFLFNLPTKASRFIDMCYAVNILIYGGEEDVWFWKLHDKGHKGSQHSTPHVCPQGAAACYKSYESSAGRACS